MSVIALVVLLCFLGVLYWLVSTKGGGMGMIATIIKVVLVIVAVILCLYAFGVWGEVKSIQVPRI